MSITHISKSETLKNNRLETGHIFLLISLLDKKCIHLAIFYCPCSMNLSPIPLSIQSMPFCIALPWYHMPIVWMTHCNMLIVWLPLYLYAKNPVAILLNDKLMYNMTVLRLLQNRRAIEALTRLKINLKHGVIFISVSLSIQIRLFFL